MGERLRGRLMLALFQSGRQAEALVATGRPGENGEQLGLEPGSALRALEGGILDQDAELDARVAGRRGLYEGASTTTSFVGRRGSCGKFALCWAGLMCAF